MIPPHKGLSQTIKQQLLPRLDKYSRLLKTKQLPITQQSLIIIPCLSKTYGFKTNQYLTNQKYLANVLSQQQFNNFIRKANQIVQTQLLNKSVAENEPFFKKISVLLKICTAVLALAVLFLAIVVYTSINDSASNVLLNFSLALFAISALIAALCPLVLHNSSYDSINYETIISQKLKQLQEQENHSNSSQNIKHISWHIPQSFFWIQLHINPSTITQNLRQNQQFT